MRCDRQMFPPRQLLRSTFGRGERRRCILIYQKKKKKEKERETRKKERRKISLPPHVLHQLVITLHLLSESLQRDAQSCEGGPLLSHPHECSSYIMLDRVADEIKTYRIFATIVSEESVVGLTRCKITERQ